MKFYRIVDTVSVLKTGVKRCSSVLYDETAGKGPVSFSRLLRNNYGHTKNEVLL